MSRLLGRVYDVKRIANDFENINLPKYKKDNKLSSWDDICLCPEKIEIYLPDSAIEFLNSKEIKFMTSAFRKYTLTQIPETFEEERFIRFPSLLPKNEFKRELIFYFGMILSSYNEDDPYNKYEIPAEYDELLPLLLEYLYLKRVNEEEKFSIKHLNELKELTKNFMKYYEDYEDFVKLKDCAKLSFLEGKKLQNFKELCQDKEDEMEDAVRESLGQLSSLEVTLRLIDTLEDDNDIKLLIEELMLNNNGSRAQVLQARGIESYGYPRLRKELNTRKKK